MKIGFGLALDFWSANKPLTQHLDNYGRLLSIAEDYGFNSVWAGEFRPIKSQPGHTPSPLLVLAAMANRTTLRLGTGVTLLTLWHPLRLAYDGIMLDHISDGRFTLGVGVGVAPQMKRYGVNPSEAGTRMDESLALLRAIVERSRPLPWATFSRGRARGAGAIPARWAAHLGGRDHSSLDSTGGGIGRCLVWRHPIPL